MLVWQKLSGSDSTATPQGVDPVFHSACTNNPHPKFTVSLTNLQDIRFIQPMGLGEVEPRFRTFLWINTTVAPAGVPIYAPVAGNLVDGVYKDVKGAIDYDLHFVVSCQIWYLVNHVTDPVAAIRLDLPSFAPGRNDGE